MCIWDCTGVFYEPYVQVSLTVVKNPPLRAVRENGYINVTTETYLLRQNPKSFRMSPEPVLPKLVGATLPLDLNTRNRIAVSVHDLVNCIFSTGRGIMK